MTPNVTSSVQFPATPRASVIVPVFNDAEGLLTTLHSLTLQVNAAYEVIVVDNGSTDSTLSAAEDFAKQHPDMLKVIVEPSRSSYAARNRGIRESQGGILCFIDADMTVPPNYIETILETFCDATVMLVGVPVVITVEDRTPTALYDALMGFPIRTFFEKTGFIPTNCLSVRKDVFEQWGLFDHRLESGGDREFSERARAAGCRAIFVESVTLFHPARSALSSLVKKSRRVGRGTAQLSNHYPQRYGSLWRKLLNPRSLLPIGPRTLMRRARQRGVELRWTDLVLLAWYRPVLRFNTFVGYVEGLRRVKATRPHES